MLLFLYFYLFQTFKLNQLIQKIIGGGRKLMPNVNNDDKKSKKRLMTVVALILVTLLILSSVFIYYEYFVEEKIVQETKEEPKIIDDRISPLENQALTLEVLRIRHRGLLQKLMTPGLSWRNTPQFYFKTDIDGELSNSKDISTFTKSGTVLYNTWDGINQQNKVVHDCEEEQETSDITVTLVDRVKTGLFGRKFKDIEKDTFHVVYNYRTGRWTGDDFFRDEDGYGNFIGDTFEVWFNVYQTDWDYDGIPYWTEVNILGTDPKVDDSKLDPDEDGIPTAWEWKWGYDPFKWNNHKVLDPDIDGIENTEEYKMRNYFADPFQQNIYIEVDGMEGKGFADKISPHKYYEESGQALIERFCQHGITVVIDGYGWSDGPKNGGGEVLPHVDIMGDTTGDLLRFYSNNFPDERKGVFRYVVISHQAGFCYIAEFNRYDAIAVGTSLGRMWAWFSNNKHAYTPRMYRFIEACAVMHELGHTIGLAGQYFYGVDSNWNQFTSNVSKKEFMSTWGKYVSVMNYYHMNNRKLFDYSDGSNGPPYDQNDWEHIFLPRFEINDLAIEGATFDGPIVDELGPIGRLEFGMDQWNYSSILSDTFKQKINDRSPIDPIQCDWRIYIDNTTETSNGRDIRVYALPLVEPSPAEYVLVDEGYLDAEGTMVWNVIQY
jgi:hypothetical protein